MKPYTADYIANPERQIGTNANRWAGKSKKPSLEWMVFVITEICDNEIWLNDKLGNVILYEAAIHWKYRKKDVLEFLSERNDHVIASRTDLAISDPNDIWALAILKG